MLNLYRRHLSSCKNTLRSEKKCSCPVWVQGTLHGTWMKKSVGVRNWEAAQKIVRDWEAGTRSSIPMKDACERFLHDCKARGLGDAQYAKYERLTKELSEDFGERTVSALAVDDLAAYREGWKLSAVSSKKKLERLRTLFKFCAERGWIGNNPALLLKPPQERQKQVEPFTDSEVEKILRACELYPERPRGRRAQIKAFVLLLRYSGLRIGDAIKVRRADFSGNKLLVPTQKTGRQVWLPLPHRVCEAVLALPGTEHLFWSGEGKLKSAVADWQRSLKKLFQLAGVKGHAHRFRHTFSVSLLSSGVSLENVSVLLGHASLKVTERHYAAFVKARQIALETEIEKAWKL